jgi:uncharacterized protein YggE
MLRARVRELERATRIKGVTLTAKAPKMVEVEVVKPATVKAVERAIDRADAAHARVNGILARLHEVEELLNARGAELQGVTAACWPSCARYG